MLNRIFTGIILVSFFITILLYGSGLIIASLFSIISIYAFYEWLKICKTTNKDIFTLISFALIMMTIFLLYYTHPVIIFLAYASIFIWLLILFDLLYGLNIYIRTLKTCPKAMGLVFILTTWILFISLGNTTNSEILSYDYLLFSNSEPFYISQYYLFLIALVSLTDMSGFFVGKLVGNRKLSPIISPNKTIEGFVASILIPVIAFYITFTYIFTVTIFLEDIFYMLICCIFCTVGDLFVSSYKRLYEVKDSGKLLPGHGGVLDRLDSYLPTIAILHIWLFL